MKSTSLLIIAATGCLGLGLLWQGAELRKLKAANQRLSAEAAELPALRSQVDGLRQIQVDQDELTRLRESEAARSREIMRLRRQLGELLRAQTKAEDAPPQDQAATAGSTNANPQWVGAVADWLRAASEQAVEAQIFRARERLNLSLEQEQNVRAAVSNAVQEGRENLRRLISKQVSFEEVPTQMQWAKALEQQVLSVLTPEQQAAYQKQKQEDIAANARLVANGELLHIQNRLGLNQEQQDQVFAVLYSQAIGQLDPDPNTLANQPHNPIRAAELQGKQKLASLQGVLTPSQLETYGQMHEAYLRLLQGTLGQLGSK